MDALFLSPCDWVIPYSKRDKLHRQRPSRGKEPQPCAFLGDAGFVAPGVLHANVMAIDDARQRSRLQ